MATRPSNGFFFLLCSQGMRKKGEPSRTEVNVTQCAGVSVSKKGGRG